MNKRLTRRPSKPLLETLEGRRLFAVSYAVTDLAPDAGGTHTGRAYGVSDNGQVALQYDGNAAVWKNGVVTDLGFKGYATDVNDNGTVVGADTTTGTVRPFVYFQGTKYLLTLGNRSNGIVNAINDNGTCVGVFYGNGIENLGFVAGPGQSPVSIGKPAGFDSIEATGINDNGQIVGNAYSTTNGFRAFIKGEGVFKTITNLPGNSTTRVGHGLANNGTLAVSGNSGELYNGGPDKIYKVYTVGSNGYGAAVDRGTFGNAYDVGATDINTAGVITADTNPGLNDSFALRNSGSGFQRLDDLVDPGLGWHFASAKQVNDSGWIVGYGFKNGQASPYLLKPIASPTYKISGRVFNDTNKNGDLDAGEQGSGVRTVFIDANGNGQLDNGETSTQSNASGNYEFTGLAPGSYSIARVLPAGYYLTADGGNELYVPATITNANVAGVNLGSAQSGPAATGTITGVVFNDTNKNGVRNPGEATSGVRTVFIDTNGNKKLDAGEKSTQSNGAGVYSFTGLTSGQYRVTRVFPAGYKLSNNAVGYLTINVNAGQAVNGINLGSRTA